MPRAKRNGGYRVFVDSSVLFAAVLSPSGGSFRIFKEANDRDITLFISSYVLDEVREALGEKRPDALPALRRFFIHFPILFAHNAPKFVLQKYIGILPLEDAPILAAAIRAKATHLLTLDKKHFLNPLGKDDTLPIAIMTPGDFIQKYFI